MKRYKVNLTYPSALEIKDKVYLLFPGQEIELPDAEIVKTYEGLGYISALEDESTMNNKIRKKGGEDAS